MKIARHGKLRLTTTAAAVVLTIAGLLLYLREPTRGLPYRDSFAAGRTAEWRAFGGTWETMDGAVRNNSDERGAKLLTGSHDWRNYSIDADVMLLGAGGDAGLLIRSNNEEEGVDSYMGYYAGLRSSDSSLVLGRAEYGWMENDSQLSYRGQSVQPFRWYHLKLLAYGCQIAASVALPSGQPFQSISIHDPECMHSGRIGLRSYSSGGAWRNVMVRVTKRRDLLAMLATGSTSMDAAMQAIPADNPQTAFSETLPQRKGASSAVANPEIVPISSLRLASPTNRDVVRVQGVVVLTRPELVVEDASGGVVVYPDGGALFKVGDEVAVRGEAHPGDFSSTIDSAAVQILWSRTPDPAVAVTALQAATGAYDARFVEVEGYLVGKSQSAGGMLVLDLNAGQQSFRALMRRGRGDALFAHLRPDSLLRLSGICTVSSTYTGNLTPFVLLLRSGDDLKVVSGPPWWTVAHIAALIIGVLALALATTFSYSRAETRRQRAITDERERLAHEIHDTLSQSFAGIGFQLEAIRTGVPGGLAAVHQQLDQASRLVRHSYEEARRSITSLRHEAIKAGDLAFALESCALRMVGGGSVRIATTRRGELRRMSLKTVDTLYRIGQEAIANAVRHAAPSNITITVEYTRTAVSMSISDDGRGFRTTEQHRGFGIDGMRKRAAAIHAVLAISSQPLHGSCVTVSTYLPQRTLIPFWSSIQSPEEQLSRERGTS